MKFATGTALSIGFSVLLSGIGYVLDQHVVFYGGLLMLVAFGPLYLYTSLLGSSGRLGLERTTSGALPIQLSDERPPDNFSEEERALFMLKRARTNADIALSIKGKDKIRLLRQSYYELLAAIETIGKVFSINNFRFNLPQAIDFEQLCSAYGAYVDKIYPFLIHGHIEQARKISNDFSYHFRYWSGSD